MTGNDTPTPGGETPSGADSMPGETPTTPGTGETPGTTTEQLPADRRENERLTAALKRANAEAKEYRVKAEELDKIKAAQLTEQERTAAKLADLQQAHDAALRAHQEYRVGTEVRLQAAQLGFADPDDATRLLDQAIEYDEDGTPNNVPALLKELLKTKPYLAGKRAPAAPTAGGATAPARSQNNSQPITQEYINELTADAYGALSQEKRQEIAAWQAGHPFRFGRR